MCSILGSNLLKNDYEHLNYHLQLRGPDNTTLIHKAGYGFLHNLLSMTGEITPQPFIEDDIVCLYNGEIYNFKEFGDYDSDGKCLIPLYKEYGNKFVKMLDGEFAIVLFDFSNGKVIISSDVFRTKPLFYSIDNGNFGFSTFEQPLVKLGHKKISKFPPNTTRVLNLVDLSLIEEHSVYDFNLDQYKDSFTDWNIAFENSIRKRTEDFSRDIFIGLSSGYDSGGICLELIKQKKPFKAYSVIGTENDEIFRKRWNLIEKTGISEFEILHKNNNQAAIPFEDYVNKNLEPFLYTISAKCPYTQMVTYTEHIPIQRDWGTKWLSYVCSKAKKDNRKMYLSGMGADEIFSDYGFRGQRKFHHSNFGGYFPPNLKTIFPWNSFYESTMESYLAKEEYVGGSYGQEARYPYLDKYVVQEFLNLTTKLKNSKYKSVIDNLLTENNFPYCEGQKLGF